MTNANSHYAYFENLEKTIKISRKFPIKVAIMAVKITIAVEKTAKGQDHEIGETLSITVVMKGECAFILILFHPLFKLSRKKKFFAS